MRCTTSQEKKERFLSSPHFAVAGASQDQSRRASKILGWYRNKHMDVIPVHPKAKDLDGLRAVPSIANLPSPSTTALSIATMPPVTLTLLQQARTLSIPSIWIQPGAADQRVIDYIKSNDLSDRVIYGGPCILSEGDGIVHGQWFDEIYDGQF
ncbi:hypothetical protein Hypma_007542 [Hypsizygus marmoreus]|uniref:CoA-binding domain-containing protein n=1 Tax=Hypsizygus marmoreus TaxID=39966 RepID=A0A369JWX0_HYPMA|nr:hypothetical protein Hypma_007542 [Hypsizygus marmoreus]